MGLRDQWYENAIIYCLDVETYADSDGDGIGDFTGLTRRLDYLSGLGVTCLWLLPFYPSPNRDDGYDVSDFCSVDPRYGSMADFDQFVLEADERGIHVIVDLVPNHTSDEHPWFQAARRGRNSRFHDYYVWTDEDPGDTSDQVVFPGEQKGIWTFDEEVGRYYLHQFHDFQPDVNITNPDVRDEFRKVMGQWLQQGVDGFRIDAVPFLISLTGLAKDGQFEEAHQYLRELKQFATVRSGNAILLGEVDVGLSTVADYFGGGNELQALFNFIINRYIFLSLAQESADAIKFGLNQLPSIPGTGQWVNFMRHHDELNLGRLTNHQRQQIFERFGPDPNMQIYNRGLRRRLAPMLGGDQARIRSAYSLMYSLPGAPLLFYGEEIGMGENLDVPGRLSVRTPMQWTAYGNGGFSTADPTDFVRPVLNEGEFGCQKVNVGSQRADSGSLLNWMAALNRTRRECGEIGSGVWKILDTGSDAVLGMRHDVDDSAVIIFNNLSSQRHDVAIDLPEEDLTTATDLFNDRTYAPFTPNTRSFRIAPYGYRWIRVRGIY